MGKSKIQWCEQTWNPVVGCSIVSPGCTNCYAMRDAWRKHHNPGTPHYHGLTKKVNGNPVWTGKLARASEAVLLAPLKRKKTTTYFVNSMGDLFHEDCEEKWIDQVFAVMALSPQHTFQVLTKRAARMREYFDNDHREMLIGVALGNMLDGDWVWGEGKKHRKEIERLISAFHGIEYDEEELPDGSVTHGDEHEAEVPWPLPNVWLGVSTERQQEADERIPLLLQAPAAVRFISAEPLLGEINLHSFFDMPSKRWINALDGIAENCAVHEKIERLDWVISGGESGPKARAMHPAWAMSLRDQCAASDVPYFFKQWGEFAPGALNDRWEAVPNDGSLRIDDPRLKIAQVTRVGKKAAGRLLDGVEHNGFPKVRG